MTRFDRSLLLALLLPWAGCSDRAAPYESEVARRGDPTDVSCGRQSNGPQLTGTRRLQDCSELESVSLASVVLAGGDSADAVVQDARLESRAREGGAAPPSLLNATMTGVFVTRARTLRVDAVEPLSHDVTAYRLSVQENDGTFTPLCRDASNVALMAIPLAGRWGLTAEKISGGGELTFACEQSAAYKCAMEAGYKPWQSRPECRRGVCRTRSLEPYHQACVRMLRADYCGDGFSHTVAGVPLDIYDNLGIQSDTSDEFPLEAEWSMGGATCVTHTRISNDPEANYESVRATIERRCPERLARDPAACGGATSTFGAAAGFGVPLTRRALLRSEASTQIIVPPAVGASP